ncbi:MAG: YdcF family protein [Clostridiales bacterium]|jgi:uncharacterized SAM-binding protein YcdF (DUF218 family)|nr:YdcF family protein [Clostridiales bacterium]
MAVVLAAASVLVFLGLFLIVSHYVKATIWNGFLFVCLLASLAIFLILLEREFGVMLVARAAALFFILILLLAAFGVYVLIGLLLINARLVLKRERFRLANCLGLALAIALSAATAASWAARSLELPAWANAARAGISLLMAYYGFHILNYILSTALCCMARPPLSQDYVVVLGCGLTGGKVSPMLARRVDRGIAFCRRQAERGGAGAGGGAAPPKLVLSGGRGPDEPVSEAEAMRDYAIGQGVPGEAILLEAESRTTRQNMEYSKRIMDGDAGGRPYSCIYATSGYHVLRAGVYARKAGLRAGGIGARTAPYYLPNALLREYIAYIVMYRKLNIAMGAALFAGGALFSLLSQAR